MWYPLNRSEKKSVSVRVDQATMDAVNPFDYAFTGTVEFAAWDAPKLPSDYQIGVIVGASGSGKSTLLPKILPAAGEPVWDETLSIVSQLGAEANDLLAAVGLHSVPTWCKPRHVLSTGEGFRADLAWQLGRHDVLAVDEYTSVVDRNVAMAASNSLSRYIRQHKNRRLIVATCHRDVLPWLQPDWVIDLDTGTWSPEPQECLQRPELVVEVYEATRPMWDIFAPHHYLSDSLHPFARCYIATIDGKLAAFGSAIPFPHGTIKGGWRETRTVTLPDFQGLGIGVHLSDWIAEAHVRSGARYFSRTTHPRMGEYRERHPNWKPTRTNRKKRQNIGGTGLGGRLGTDDRRVAYSHEYVLSDS